MPTIFLWNGYRFYFFSNEVRPTESRHIHVRKGENVAEFWLDPEPVPASSQGMTGVELNTLERAVRRNVELFRSKWD